MYKGHGIDLSYRLEMKYGDIEMMASEFADIAEGDYEDAELIEMAGMEDQAEDLLEEIEYSEEEIERLSKMRDSDQGDSIMIADEIDRLNVYIFQNQQEVENLGETAREAIIEERTKEIKKELRDNPIEFLKEELGIDVESMMNYFVFDIDGAISDLFASIDMVSIHFGRHKSIRLNHMKGQSWAMKLR